MKTEDKISLRHSLSLVHLSASAPMLQQCWF